MNSRVGDTESFNLVPAKHPITSTGDWLHRHSYSDRKAYLIVHPVSSDGQIEVSFTKEVSMPEDARERIQMQRLVNVTFVPAVYDNDEAEVKTGLKSW